MLLIAISVTWLTVFSASQANSRHPSFRVSPPSQCQQNGINWIASTIRYVAFLYFNQLRHEVANGKQAPGERPRLMYGTRYDCNLEKKASRLLKNNANLNPRYVVLKHSSTTGTGFPFSAEILRAFKQWRGKQEIYSTLTSPNVPLFGCAHNYIRENGRMLEVICIFDKRNHHVSSKNLIQPCQRNKDCKWHPNSTCRAKLCWAPSPAS
ncbi:hypothetical protein Q1695_004222 [Nippostrongylus brasiliensis]|nr:hypothetical protein Q1695_004222 [Nippostrongylus brasiliensis]